MFAFDINHLQFSGGIRTAHLIACIWSIGMKRTNNRFKKHTNKLCLIALNLCLDSIFGRLFASCANTPFSLYFLCILIISYENGIKKSIALYIFTLAQIKQKLSPSICLIPSIFRLQNSMCMNTWISSRTQIKLSLNNLILYKFEYL